MKKPFYITTPIYYASGNLHIGHCCTSIFADSIARFKRLEGYDVMFLTGADEHGQKVEEKAKELGMTPQEFVDSLDIKFKELWNLLHISYDRYIRTTDKNHVEVVKKIYQKLLDQGDLYKSEYEGWYCVPCESFFTESQLVDGKCPDCGREVKLMKEESYFFRLSKYQKRLEQYYEEHPDFIRLEATKHEMLNSFIKPGLQDLCVSRTSFKWGVPLPFDDKHVSYVWIDALANYITALGYMQEDDSLFKKYWPADLHLMAKEIVRFHVIIWPILLMALDLPIPKRFHAHGWVTGKNGAKMSKSMGNGVNPLSICDRYGVDALRYYILRNGPIMKDSEYSAEGLINAINNDLCNSLGNLLSRTTAMIVQNFNGILPKCENSVQNDIDKSFVESIISMPGKVKEKMEDIELNNAIQEIWNVINNANKYIEETTPWSYKEDKQRLSAIFSNLYFALYSVATLLKAFLPDTAKRIAQDLGIDEDELKLENINVEYKNTLQNLTVTKNTPLFPRLKVEEELKFLNN